MSTAAKLKRAAREAREARARERASTRRAALYAAPPGGTLLSAMAPRDVLADFAAFAAFDRNGLACDISFTCPGHATWTLEVARFALELTRANMRALYEAAPGWGWKEGAKRAELADGENRYLVARAAARGSGSSAAAAAAPAAGGDPAAAAPPPAGAAAAGGGAGAGAEACQPGDLLGFVSFRFLPEGEYDLLYIYELQMGPHAQRRGLGKHMMQICELVARKCGMHCVQLTVLKNNTHALDFYTRKMKYCVDSDIDACDESAAHTILTKVVDAKAVAAIKAAAAEEES